MGTVGAKVEPLAEKAAAAEGTVQEDGARGDPGLVGGESEDGVRVSINGKEEGSGGAGATEVPGDGNEDGLGGGRDGGLEDFEMNGVSSLLKMKGSGRAVDIKDGQMKGSGRVVDIKDGSLAPSVGVDEDAEGVKSTLSAPALAGGDASGAPGGGRKILAVDENGVTLADAAEEIGKISESTSEPADGEGEDVGDCQYSVGDLVWGKVKSHPWWPGQIYDLSDASDFAAKLRTKRKHLVSYFGDGTFAWCHPTQLKPFEENFEVMTQQSTSKNFLNAVEAVVDQIGRFVNMRMTCSCVPMEKRLTRPLVGNSGIKEEVFVSDDGIGRLSVVWTEPRKLLSHLKFMTHLASTSGILELAVLKNWLLAFYSAKGFDQLPGYHEAVEIPGLEDLREDVAMVDGKVGIPFQGPVLEEWLSSPIEKALLQKCHGASANGGYKKPKQKSIAEIIGGNLDTQADVNQGNKTKEGAGSSVKEKKVNVDEAGIDDKSSSKNESVDFKRSDSNVEMDSGICGSRKEETKKSGRKRKRISSPEISGPRDKEQSKHSVITEGKVKEGSNTEASDGDSEQLEKGFLSRERKKSKYLSPPYMNIGRGQKKGDIDAESIKISSLVRLGERMVKAADNLKGSASSLKSECSKGQEKDVEESGTGHRTFGEKIPETQGEGDNKIVESMKVTASANDVLSEVRAVAVDPVHARESKSDVVEEFFPVYRSSVYRNGSNYKTFNKRQLGRKRKSHETEPESLKGAPTDRSETSGKSTPSKPGRERIKKNESKMDTPKSQPASKRSSGKKNLQEVPGRLLVTFSPGASLPTKDDLIKIYSKFGVLNETETDMCYNSLYALVVFQKNSNAEEALKSSQKENPFGSANASFELQCDSATPKTHGDAEDSPLPRQHSNMTPKKQSALQSSTGEASELQYIKLKLEKMTSMVDKSHGKLSKKMKSSLEGEIKDLLEKVSSSGRS
ncbi:PWWP domain-containing protein 3-like [Syzygium oleosum]|uniref:PWWP domain-containing protein 3-like n=1 Tax=Syzygium oleosum TaxID=219896 RepID=UPI0011D2973E|nr:PWWP domain-containing protein 3-like [Syzygium oleosum]